MPIEDQRKAAIARAIVESATDFAIVTTDLGGTITSWNPGAEALLGWDTADAIGNHVCMIFTPEDTEAGICEREMETARDKGRSEDERWHLRRDKTRLWASGLMMRFEDEQTGEHVGYLKLMRDRSAQHAHAELMRESERQYRTLAQALPGFVFATDGGGRHIFGNDQFQSYTGLAQNQLAGDGWLDAVHEDERRDVRAAWYRAVGAGERFSRDLRFVRHDGAVRCHRCDALPLRADDGSIERWIGTCLDVEDAHATQRDLEFEKRLLDAVVSQAPIGVSIARADRGATLNQRATEILGHGTKGEGLERYASYGAVHADGRPYAVDDYPTARALTKGERVEGEEMLYRRLGPDGAEEIRRLEISSAPIHGADGGIAAAATILFDVEEERAAQDALNRLNLDLEHAVDERTAELREQTHRLEHQIAAREKVEDALRQAQKMEAVGQLTGGVAHDFNNLLTIIKSSVELLQRPNLADEKRGRYIAAIAETTDRAARLTSQLLAFARRQPLTPTLFDVREKIEALLPILRTTVGSRIEVALAPSPDEQLAEVDLNQFETAILNVTVNARDAMPEGGTLTIAIGTAGEVPATRNHVAAPGDYVTVRISDTGTGMDAATLRRIFEPFYTTKDVGRGTGLGLSQVYGFAKQSSGEVIAESEEGVGTTFTIFLPRATTVMPIAVETADPGAHAPRDDHHGCILVVEDNQLVGEFARQILEDIGYGTVWAPNGQIALEELERDCARFDAIFSDVVMPGMSGIDLGLEVQRLYPSLPVVLTSGYSQALATEGSHGFELLRKPYSASKVVDTLARVISEREPGPAA